MREDNVNPNRTPKTVALALAASLALGLSACSAQPGTALEVDGVGYSTTELEAGATQLTEMMGQEVSATALVAALVQVRLIEELSDEVDIKVGEKDIADFVASGVESKKIPTAPDGPLTRVASDYFGMLVRTNQLNSLQGDEQRLQQVNDAYTKIRDNVRIAVNPRFSGVDQSNQVVQRTFGDVVSSSRIGAIDPTGETPRGGQ